MITLPSNLVWVTDDLAVAIVPGDLFYFSPNQPPLVASRNPPRKWAQYEPCESCGGDVLMAGKFGVDPLGLKRCPDCRDGLQVREVRWWCGICIGNGTITGANEEEDLCFDCGGNGYLSARATLQVVPVVALDDLAFTLTYPCVTVNVRANQPDALLELTANEFHDVSSLLDPLPVPGRDYALVVRKVPS